MPRQGSLGLAPQTLIGAREATPAQPQKPVPGQQPANPYANVPPQSSQPQFQGQQNPGPYAQPAAFNPLLALTLLSQAGQMGGGARSRATMPMPSQGQQMQTPGPVGGFGVGMSAPGLQPRPRNPYVAGFANK